MHMPQGYESTFEISAAKGLFGIQGANVEN
jgi:hypothetical protein